MIFKQYPNKVIILILLGTLGALLGCRYVPSEPDAYIYSVKFVCVPEVGLAEFAESEAPFEPALYRTAIDVHNSTDRRITITKKAVLARSEDLNRGPISGTVTEELEPDQALFIDCLDVALLLEDELAGSPAPPGDGFVVIESDVRLDVVAVYTSQLVERKQEILYRFVTEPFKVRVVHENGPGRDRLPPPGEPPFEGFHAEVMSVDFEKTFGVLNKVIYEYKLHGWAKECPGENCTGTREILFPAPEPGVPFPNPDGPEGEAKSLEDLIRPLDRDFKKIIDVEATMYQTDRIKQEITYRWVSDPLKTVVDFREDVVVDVKSIVEDEDKDGQTNEDGLDGVDNDGDGLFDEDPPLTGGRAIEILDTDIAVGVGESEDVEYVEPTTVKPPRRPPDRPSALVIVIVVLVCLAIVVVIIVVIIILLVKKRGDNY